MIHRQVMSTETIVENYSFEILGNKVWTKLPPSCTTDQAKDLKKLALCKISAEEYSTCPEVTFSSAMLANQNCNSEMTRQEVGRQSKSVS